MEGSMRRLVVAASIISALVTPQHARAQAFQVRSIRDGGPVVAATRTVGDWLAVGGYSMEAHGGEVAYRMLSARASFGSVARAGAKFDLVIAGADVSVGFGSVPIMLLAGAEYGRATVEEDVTITSLRVPLQLASSAVLVFDRAWVHPILAAGATFKRLETDEASGGVEGAGTTGLEAGVGRISLRATLHHELTARQQGVIALRLRF
jgi:hypothetical protein